MNAAETTLHSVLLLALLLLLPAFAVNSVSKASPVTEGAEVAMQAGLPVGTMPAFDVEAVAPSAPVAFEVAADFEIVVTSAPVDVPA